ncbi:cadherin-related family member 5 isoform X2 [Crotalus tigris]|uniref:cadherin-related family member 5 isoform X2 n=1 Tax=Crotalus tigris TaxID=88082 RepID=UPI00192F3AF8|nr:cadherin-related family member 5 isoform X2 [Crotalus tigris]
MAFLRPFCSCVLFLLLAVTRVETQRPECSTDKDFVEINENNNPGLVVTNIRAGPGIVVTIKPSTDANSPSEWFEIKDSELILKKSVDYESVTYLQVELICWKEGLQIKSFTVSIEIQNENDNEPMFKQNNITVNVPEDTKPNTIVVPLANVTATDADLNTLFYSLEGSPPEAMNYFNIQGINNPQIFLRKVLDYEAMNFMEFTLRAMDGNAGAAGTHTATATISIRIVQSDLRPPWFQPCTAIGGRRVCISLGYNSKVNLSEIVSEPLTFEPGPLYAIDGDKSLNEKIIYEIAAGNDNDTFLINTITGNITMTQPANTLKTFMLYILASQENNPFRYSQTTVKIDVVRKNVNQPYFEEAIYLGRASVDQPAKTLIMKANTPSEPLQIFAADDDFLPDKINPDIKYRIQNSSDFRVTAEGFIQTTEVLNGSSHITLLAIATDISTLEEASTLISIDVTPLAKRSQRTVESIKTSSPTTTQALPQSGPPKPSTSGNFVTSGGAVQSSTSSKIGTTKSPITSARPAPDDGRQSTSVPGIIKPSTTSTPSVANTSATSLPSKSSTSTPSISTSAFVSSKKPSIEYITTSSGSSPVTSTTNSEGLYNVGDMAALGVTLGTLLAIALALLALISYKYYKLKKELEKENLQLMEGFSNTNFQDDQKSNSDGKDDESPASIMSKKEPPNKETQSARETTQEEEINSEKEVKSILTKDRKMEDDGYKAVWFKDDITEAKEDDMMIEEDSDLEQNRFGSESDSAAEEGDYHDDTDSGRGDSDINISARRVQFLDTNPSASQSHEEAEEHDDAL